MFELLRLRIRHGRPVVRDLEKAVVAAPFRGFPQLDEAVCAEGCAECAAVCPTGAIKMKPLGLDLGACIFCGACERACPGGAIKFTNGHRLGADRREALIVESGRREADYAKEAVRYRQEIKRRFGRSLKLRQVSAAGCNGCEMELGACGNVNFDMGRLGVEFTASPRHADGIVITGPVSRNMAPALKDAWLSTAEPRILIVVGACAVSGGLFAESEAVDRSFLDGIRPDLYVPGCPPHPLTFIRSVMDFLD
jgi:Ni,Fe-hydrogenase III small subunit/NAD-dependent dihydropyrimidine dehydrogenase PreA subunit